MTTAAIAAQEMFIQKRLSPHHSIDVHTTTTVITAQEIFT